VGTEIWLAEILALDLKVRYRGVGMGPPHDRYDDTFLSVLGFEGGRTFHF